MRSYSAWVPTNGSILPYSHNGNKPQTGKKSACKSFRLSPNGWWFALECTLAAFEDLDCEKFL